jgi:ribokinase
MGIVVFGSINMDLVARTPRLPAPGETLTGYSFTTVPGGKGANQAVACARLGAPTQMVGRVGGDVFGDALLENLESNTVNSSHVIRDMEVASGVALIAVDDYAENTIIVIPGANGRVGSEDLERLSQALEIARILLLQLEIPLEIVVEAAKIAHDMGVTVILDPAPAQVLPDELYPWVDILTPNQTEASILAGFRVGDEGSIRRAAQVLLERGVQRVIIKMGDLGAYIATEEGSQHHPAIPVVAIDTVAAGDAFNGALAAALLEKKSFDDAVRWGLAGGALAVTKEGAQGAMPERDAVLKLLAEYSG